ncbi:MAG: hypothetical protein V3S29_08440, partial [bacterium]
MDLVRKQSGAAAVVIRAGCLYDFVLPDESPFIPQRRHRTPARNSMFALVYEHNIDPILFSIGPLTGTWYGA